MHTIASRLFGQPTVGGSCRDPAAAAMVLLLCLGFLPTVATCPPDCLCASDIISCSGRNLSVLHFDLPSYATRLDLSHNAIRALRVGWVSQPFHRLTTLVLSRNLISQIEVAAFAVTPRLLHLDLSSNQLAALNSSIFTGLKELKELLLIGNQIADVNPGAFSDLSNLQRLYLSENPLLCDCSLLALLEYWMWKQYRPLVDFRGEYPCRGNAEVNCTHQGVTNFEAQIFQVDPGEWLRVPCPGLTLPVQEAKYFQFSKVCIHVCDLITSHRVFLCFCFLYLFCDKFKC
uniref:LRRNT domain-containing protein n=1 Tax=Kryptolebias marmoratus TaxID=37003 RepID=A0A3Q3H059_KRYMA